jgi:hypothetical protein
MTMTQTVNIPADHRLVIDVPREVPEGPVILTFTPAAARRPEPAPKNADEAVPIPDSLKRILSQPTPHADALLGILSGLGDITLEQIRDERLAKHLK